MKQLAEIAVMAVMEDKHGANAKYSIAILTVYITYGGPRSWRRLWSTRIVGMMIARPHGQRPAQALKSERKGGTWISEQAKLHQTGHDPVVRCTQTNVHRMKLDRFFDWRAQEAHIAGVAAREKFLLKKTSIPRATTAEYATVETPLSCWM